MTEQDSFASRFLDERHAERDAMVREQMEERGIRDSRVLEALRRVPRHLFVPPAEAAEAYEDHPLPIGEGQTISQPYIVALMTETLQLTGTETVLEIGAGSGYQSAILSVLCRRVIAIERHAPLAARARTVLDRLGIENVHLLVADGSRGWPAEAPYDAILVAAGAPSVPDALKEQLAPSGRLILPVGGERMQTLHLLRRDLDGTFTNENLGDVAFVPLIGAAGFGLPDDLGDIDI